MRKILVPVEAGNDQRLRAALLRAVQLRHAHTEIHLLNVQPRVNAHVAMFFGRKELDQLQQRAGHEELAPARAWMADAGVPFTWSIEVGRRAETIALVAKELGCDAVVFGGPSQEGAAEGLLGSIGTQVRHLLGSAGGCTVIGA